MKTSWGWIRYTAKAAYAGAVAFLGTTATALIAIGEGAAFGELSAATWLTIAATTLVASGGVFKLSNATKPD